MGHRRHHRHRHRSRRPSKSAPVVEPEPEPLQSPVAPRVFSNIHPIYLEESVQGGIGQYVSVSVLEPVMRVERSRGNCASDPCRKPMYRIVLNFRMQLAINKRGNELKRHNRIFDSVSVRYLYRSGEKHDLLPKGDNIVTDIGLSHETGKSSEVEAGVAGFAGHIAPGFTVHAQHASKLTYERRVASWRKALTYEAYPPLLGPKSGGGLTSLFAPALHTSEPEPLSFRVSSAHAPDCTCRRFRRCRRRLSRHDYYDRAAHWTGQTEAQLHLWTPEIYENLNSPLTITREVCADEIDDILSGNGAPSYGRHVLRKHLHFDFDVEVRLREIGWGFWNLFKSSSKPPEIRAKNDHGKPLPTDKFRFCVTCCTKMINWPQFETRNLQTEAEEQTALHGYVRRLQSTEEYEDTFNNNNSPAAAESTSHGTATAASPSHIRPRRITHSPDGRLRIFGRRYSLSGFFPQLRHHDLEGTRRSLGDDIYERHDERDRPNVSRGRGLDRDYHRQLEDRDEEFHETIPPGAPSPPSASEAMRHRHVDDQDSPSRPPFIVQTQPWPARRRSTTPTPVTPTNATQNRRRDEDECSDLDSPARGRTEYEFKLLPAVSLSAPNVAEEVVEGNNEGRIRPPCGDVGTKSPAPSSYRQPTVLTISSASVSDEGDGEDEHRLLDGTGQHDSDHGCLASERKGMVDAEDDKLTNGDLLKGSRTGVV